MIKTFSHKGLKNFFTNGDGSKIQTDHIKKLRLLLANLNASTQLENMNLPGLALHKLQCNKDGFWSVRINGNWRLIFRFDGGDAYDVDYIDYH
jgi:proteic killer suppression protein